MSLQKMKKKNNKFPTIISARHSTKRIPLRNYNIFIPRMKVKINFSPRCSIRLLAMPWSIKSVFSPREPFFFSRNFRKIADRAALCEFPAPLGTEKNDDGTKGIGIIPRIELLDEWRWNKTAFPGHRRRFSMIAKRRTKERSVVQEWEGIYREYCGSCVAPFDPSRGSDPFISEMKATESSRESLAWSPAWLSFGSSYFFPLLILCIFPSLSIFLPFLSRLIFCPFSLIFGRTTIQATYNYTIRLSFDSSPFFLFNSLFFFFLIFPLENRKSSSLKATLLNGTNWIVDTIVFYKV